MHFGRSGGRYEEVLLIVILHFLARIWKGTPDAVDSLCLCWRDPLHIHGLFPPFQKYKLCKPGNFFPLKSQLQSFDSYFHHVMDCFLCLGLWLHLYFFGALGVLFPFPSPTRCRNTRVLFVRAIVALLLSFWRSIHLWNALYLDGKGR